jgi:ATP-binding cassette subfamily F protein 3
MKNGSERMVQSRFYLRVLSVRDAPSHFQGVTHMRMIQVNHVGVNHAGKVIFTDLSWAIGERERIGLVGPNGAGKSSLLRVVSGESRLEHGSVTRMGGITLGLLTQDITLPTGTLWDAATEPSPEFAEAQADVEAAEARLGLPEVYNDPDALEAALAVQQAALLRWERLEPERQRSLVREILTRLGFTPDDDTLPTSALSGGQKKLVALARLAAWSPDVLLLDEPDNHLDLQAKSILSAFIRSYRGSVVVVSHDRTLLDEIATHIAELEDGKLTVYPGNYSRYAVEREIRRMRQQQLYATQQREIARIEARIKAWDIAAKADEDERAARQAASRRKMLARMEANGEMVERVNERQYMEVQFSSERGSTKAVELKDVAMGFGDDLLFVGLNLLVQNGERVGLIGANGAGKSVLFKLILGQLEPLEGLVRVGPSVKVGYYAQQHETLAAFRDRTPIDLIRDIQPMAEGSAVHKLLRFAFTYEQTRQPIFSFSGGERSRLQLLALMLQQPNLLLLDEPTNNLDIGSAEVLEAALDEYTGTILTISHDRYFLDRIVNRIVELEDGSLSEYVGGYSDYVEQKAERQRRAAELAAKKAKVVAGKKGR